MFGFDTFLALIYYHLFQNTVVIILQFQNDYTTTFITRSIPTQSLDKWCGGVITLAIMVKYIQVSQLHSNFRPCFIPKMSFISFLRAHRHCQYLPHLVGKVLPNDSREMASTRPRPPLVRYLQQSDSAWHLHAVFRLLTQKHPDCDQICGNSNHLQKPLSHALNN